MIYDLSKNFLEDSKKSEYIKTINNIIKNLRWCSFVKKEFLNEIPIKLFVLTQNFVLGLESLYNNLPYLYNAKVLSEKGGYYKIEYKYLEQMMKEIKGGDEILMNENNYHLDLIVKRLINICQKKVKFINNERKITLFDGNDNLKKNKNKGKIKTKTITNKIKEFLKQNYSDKKNFFDSNFCLTSREHNENILRKDKSRTKLYFLTEISKIEGENENKNCNKELGKTFNKINNIFKDKKDNNIVKSKSSSINQYYNKKNIITYNEKQKHHENNEISKNNYNSKEFNQISKFNPVKIKYEVNLSKKLKSILENELLFYYYKKDKIKRKVKTADMKSKTNKKENKEIKIITKISKKTIDNCTYDNNLSGNVALPYFNSAKNVHRNIRNLTPLELEEIPKKKRNSTRNKISYLYPFNITKENYLTKCTITTNTDNFIDNILFNEKYNKTLDNNKSNNNNDDEKNHTYNNNFNKTVYDIKNNSKGYRKFNGINNALDSKIESYSFKGKKYYNKERDAYNKTLYKAIKDRVEDNMFMNGQTLSPKINKNYY